MARVPNGEGLRSPGHGLISNMLCLHIYRNNLEVTDDFVKEFNETTDVSDRERLQCQSQKMLERIKVVFMTSISELSPISGLFQTFMLLQTSFQIFVFIFCHFKGISHNQCR